jgi:hypothetical protein
LDGVGDASGGRERRIRRRPAGDERDAAIRIVAVDRRDGAGNTRGLDANADGVPDPGGDIRHIVKLDLTRPTGVLDVVKP